MLLACGVVVLVSTFGLTVASVSLGPLSKLDPDVSSGDVMVLNSRQIRIMNMKYDGDDPDTFFWIGNSPDGKPDKNGMIVPYPVGSDGKTKIPAFTGQNVDLTLPVGKNIKDFTYLAIYSRQNNTNLGHVKIPSNINVPASSEAPNNSPKS